MRSNDAFPTFRAALAAWWHAVWTAAAAGKDALLAISSDAERGIRAQGFFREAAFEHEEWARVQVAVEADQRLAEQVDHAIGSVIWNGPVLTLIDIVQPFFVEGTSALFHGSLGEPGEEGAAFERAYAPLERYLVADELHYDVFIPLVGLSCETPSVALDAMTVIEQFDDEREPFWFDLQMVVRQAGIREPLEDKPLPPQYRTRLHLSYTFPKKIGADTRSEVESTRFFADIDRRLRDCLRALALSMFMRVTPWPPYLRERGVGLWSDRGVRLPQPQLFAQFYEPGATVKPADVQTLQYYWCVVREPRFGQYELSRAAGVALDRLAGLGSKAQKYDEQLVDVVIACESFFTAGHSSERQELAFRTAILAAQMSPAMNIGLSKAAVFSAVMRGYDIRSRLLHGKELKPKHLMHDGAPAWVATATRGVALNYFVWILAEIVRRGLLHVVMARKGEEDLRLDWNEVVFGEASGGSNQATPSPPSSPDDE